MDKAKAIFAIVYPIVFATSLLIALADVPFRGEHWAFLQSFETTSTFVDLVSKLSSFVTFGPRRVQPLNFVPMAFSYAVFGFHFWGHYAVSFFLHFLFAFQCAGWLAEIRVKRGPLGFREVWKLVPLEFALFLSLFVAFDVYTWTFFQYIQVAGVLAVTACRLYFRGGFAAAYACAAGACLFYEPFLVVPILFLVVQAARKRYGVAEGLLALAVLAFLTSYAAFTPVASAPITVPPSVSEIFGMRLETGHARLFQAPLAEVKPVFLLYNVTLFLWTTFRAMLWFCVSHRVNIYEMPSAQDEFGAFLPIVAFVTVTGIAAFLWLVGRRGKHLHASLIFFSFAVVLGFFSAVCLGRPEAGLYSSVQLRYAYLLSPFLLVPLLHLGERIVSGSRGYAVALLFLVAVNTASCLYQGARLRQDMRVLTDYLKDLKGHQAPAALMVADVAHAMRALKWWLPSDVVFFLYNGRGAL